MSKQKQNKFLIVEDDWSLVTTLKQVLQQRYTKTQIFATNQSQRATNLIDNHQFSLALLDKKLPTGSGLQLIDYLTEYSYQTKIVLFTQSHSAKTRKHSYQLGADDYLAKPFDMQELLVRIKSVLHKYKLIPGEIVRQHGVQLKPESGQLTIQGQSFNLMPVEAKVMSLLMANAPKPLSKEQIIRHIWTKLDQGPKPNTIEVYINRIRSKLKQHRQLIKTKRNLGYYFSGK
jgi:DNA-binding response OmpR family regulator